MQARTCQGGWAMGVWPNSYRRAPQTKLPMRMPHSAQRPPHLVVECGPAEVLALPQTSRRRRWDHAAHAADRQPDRLTSSRRTAFSITESCEIGLRDLLNSPCGTTPYQNLPVFKKKPVIRQNCVAN